MSGNFNVVAVQILGADNIDVSGISVSLPTPPAAPIGLITPTETDAQSRVVAAAIQDAVNEVKSAAATVSPSIIEVRVTGFGDTGSVGLGEGAADRASAMRVDSIVPGTASPIRYAQVEIEFNVPAQRVQDAVDRSARPPVLTSSTTRMPFAKPRHPPCAAR